MQKKNLKKTNSPKSSIEKKIKQKYLKKTFGQGKYVTIVLNHTCEDFGELWACDLEVVPGFDTKDQHGASK